MRGTEACVGCALCQPVCPTFRETREEGASARGKATLIEALDAGEIDAGDPGLAAQLELCTSCWACEAACPAGVATRDLFILARERRAPTLGERLLRAVLSLVYSTPAMARALLWAVFLPLRGVSIPARPEPAVSAAPGGDAMLAGCLARWAAPEAAAASAATLDRASPGWRPAPDGLCCGAPLVNNGLAARLPTVAEPLLEWLEKNRPARLVTPDATCAATLRHEWPGRLPGGLAERWAVWRDKIVGLREVEGVRFPEGDAVQTACHRAHAPGGGEPSDSCCGFGGTFFVRNPRLARRIGQARLAELGEDVMVEGPGCLAHLKRLAPEGTRVRFWAEE